MFNFLSYFFHYCNYYFLSHTHWHLSSLCSLLKIRERDASKPTKRGFRCDACNALTNKSKSWKNEQNRLMKEKGTMFSVVFPMLDGKGDIHNENSKSYMFRIVKTNKKDLTTSGENMRQQIKYLREWQNNSIPKGVVQANKFIRDIAKYMEHNPDYEEKIEIDLLKHAIAKENGVKGGAGLHLKMSTRMLLVGLYQKNPSSVKFACANLNSISTRNLKKNNSRITKSLMKSHGNSFIDKNEKELIQQISQLIMDRYTIRGLDKNNSFSFSYSIDGTAVVQGLFAHPESGKLVGGAYPNHAITLPDDHSDVLEIMDQFNEKKSGVRKKKADEIKIATIVMQGTIDGESPLYQLFGQPQTKNMKSDFNERMTRIAMEATKKVNNLGYNSKFLCAAVDGVSCDSDFVKENLINFLSGKQSFSGHTDTNHNVKNAR